MTATRPRPRSLPSTTTKLQTELGNLYVTVSTDEDGEPFEVFGWLGKGGSFQHGVTELACRLISLHLRRGTPLEEVIDQCQGIQEMQPFFNQMPDGRSVAVMGLADGIAHILKGHLKAKAGEGGGGRGSGGDEGGRVSGLRYGAASAGAVPLLTLTGRKEARTMVTTTDTDRAEVFSRPAAQFNGDGELVIRASAALGCRRALWYSATEYRPTNPPSEESLTVMEAGNALEPVVTRAMERAGWEVTPADTRNPEPVSMRLGPNILVTGHPDGTARMPLDGDEAAAQVQMLLFGDAAPAPAYGDPMVVEIKTRGPEAFRRWQTLGAERSHPESVAQAAFYTYGTFGGWPRDAVIATMDTGSRTWDYEVIPSDRIERALENACAWLGDLAAHHTLNGPDPDALPDRDFSAASWQCRSCPFLDICLPGAAEDDETGEGTEIEEVSDQAASDAVAAYVKAQESIKEPEKAKRNALDTLKAWMRRKGDAKVVVNGRTVSLVRTTRYSTNHRKLNEALDPETRVEIVTESESEYVRVS